MSVKQCCSLCYTACSEYKLLQNEKGESNDIYEITVKYFDPMLFTEQRTSNDDAEINVLCHDCWLHISDFHEFQQTVVMTRNSLENCNTIRQLELNVKQESLSTNKTFNDKIDDDQSCDPNSDENCETENLGQFHIQSNFGDDVTDDDDDEKPLITLMKSTRDHLKIVEDKSNEERNTENIYNQREVKHKSRRGRKRKNFATDKLKEENIPINRKKLKFTENSKKDISNYTEKGIESDNFIAEWKPELECDLCGEGSKSFQQLRQHFKEKHKTRGYIKCCERKFYRRYVLVDHIRLHLNPEMHKCDICGKPSSSQYNLKLHKKIMHENTEQFECEVCHKMFNQKPTLERHMLTHVKGSKDFVCQECGKGYVLEVQLKSHIKTVHNVDRVCDQCGRTIHGVAALKKHLLEHAGFKKPKFPCDECGAELNSRNSLRRHMAAFHHDGSTIYVCGICGKVASSENALLTHKKHVHEEVRKHKCTYCDKAFKRPKVLREHIATHTGQDLYQCPHCPQTFKVSANMHHHRKKVHPIEWEEGRKNRLQLPKVNINQVKNQVVI